MSKEKAFDEPDVNAIYAKGLLIDEMQNGVSGMIERQEQKGQEQLVRSSVMPQKGNGREAWEPLLMAGVIKGAELDDLFVEVTLPIGWLKVGSDHSMWSYLEDERGLKRAAMFYKAAFYDRDAHTSGYESRFYLSQHESVCSKTATQFAIVDRGFDRTVKLFESVCYAVQDGILGALHKGKFFSEIGGESYREVFVGVGVEANSPEIVEKDDFYTNRR